MNGELDLKTLVKLLVERKKTIVFGTLGCVVAALAASFLIPRAYESVLILEVGRIYLSPQAWTNELHFIEEPEATAQVMKSFGALDEVRRQLGLELRLRTLAKRLEITTFIEDREYLPILEIAAEGGSPREAVDVLNTLAAQVIARHSGKYEVYRQGLEERIKHTREKIAAYQIIISAQEQYRDLSQQYIEQGRTGLDEFVRELGRLDPSSPSAVDMLYLQGSALTEKQHVTDLTRFKSEMDIEIGRNRKELADAEISIVELESRRELSSPTRVISPAVATDRPVKPNRPRIAALAALVGFSLLVTAVTARRYLR